MTGAPQPRLQLVGSPQAAIISTSTALLPRQGGAVVSHDVNGYYQALGVQPGASRRELMTAYRERGGENDARLTYVFQRLLDRRFRRAYDAQPAGQPVPDLYTNTEILRHAHRHAGAQTASTGQTVTAADILFSLGVTLEEVGGSFLDSPPGAGFDDSGTGDRHSRSNSSAPSYAYLQYGSTCDDVSRMAQWQEGLARALGSQGAVPKFAVGYHGIPGAEFLVSEIGGTPVFFLHEESEVTEDLVTAPATAVSR